MSKFGFLSGELKIQARKPWTEPAFDHKTVGKFTLDYGNSRDNISDIVMTGSKLGQTGRVIVGIKHGIYTLMQRHQLGVKPLKLSVPQGVIFDVFDMHMDIKTIPHIHKSITRVMLGFQNNGHRDPPMAARLIEQLMGFPDHATIRYQNPMRHKPLVVGVGIYDGSLTLISGIYVPKEEQ